MLTAHQRPYDLGDVGLCVKIIKVQAHYFSLLMIPPGMLGDVVGHNRAGQLFNVYLFLEGNPVNHRFMVGSAASAAV